MPPWACQLFVFMTESRREEQNKGLTVMCEKNTEKFETNFKLCTDATSECSSDKNVQDLQYKKDIFPPQTAELDTWLKPFNAM